MKRPIIITLALLLLTACGTLEKGAERKSNLAMMKAVAHYQQEAKTPMLYWISSSNMLTRATLNQDSLMVRELRDYLRIANKEGNIIVIAGDNDDFSALVAINALRSMVGHLENLTLSYSGDSKYLTELRNLALGKGIAFSAL